MNNDPRFGLPSASSIQRLIECPASHAMQAEAPPEREVSQDAISGTLIHAALAGETVALTAAEEETMEMCATQRDIVLAEWSPGSLPPLGYIEQRLGLTALNTVVNVDADCKAALRFTGQADAVYVDDDRALIIDYKTGRGDTSPAIENAQVASLAVLVWKRFKVRSVRVAIIKPWAGKPTICDYNENALTLAHSWLLETLNNVEAATAEDTHAGVWCQYCRAQAGCRTFTTYCMQQVEIIDPMTIAGLPGEDQRKAMFARAMELTPEQITGAWRGLKMVERYVDAIAGAFKTRVEAGEVPGFTLREKKGRRSIADVGKVFARATAHGVSAEAFTAECSLPLGALNTLLRSATGAKGKALESIATEVLEGLTDTGKPSFEVVETTTQIEP